MNILIIGIGSISKKHIYAIKKNIKNPVIFGLRSDKLNHNKIEGVQNIFQITEIDSVVDFVIISNPTYLHYQSIISSLSLNCPLFIEKPVLSSLENYSNIKSLIKKSGVKIFEESRVKKIIILMKLMFIVVHFCLIGEKN